MNQAAEAARMRDPRSDPRTGAPIGRTRNNSQTPVDHSSPKRGTKPPMGQSSSCPVLPPLNPGGGPSGRLPSIVGRNENVEHNLITNEDEWWRIPKPKRTLHQRMIEIEKNIKVNQEEILDRREILDFFNVNKRQKVKKPKAVVTNTMMHQTGAVATPKYNAQTLTAQGQTSQGFLRRNPAMYRNGISPEGLEASDDELMLRYPPDFPPESSSSMNEKLRCFEQQAMYNAKTLSSSRKFLDEMTVMVKTSKAALQPLPALQ